MAAGVEEQSTATATSTSTATMFSDDDDYDYDDDSIRSFEPLPPIEVFVYRACRLRVGRLVHIPGIEQQKITGRLALD